MTDEPDAERRAKVAAALKAADEVYASGRPRPVPAGEMAPVVTQYTVCGLPPDHMDTRLCSIVLECRPGEKWVVRRGGFNKFIDRDGQASYGAEYTDEWREAHWFPFDQAVAVAQAAAADLLAEYHLRARRSDQEAIS